MAALEFGVPRGSWRPLWDLYVGVGLPVGGPPDLAAAGTRWAGSSAPRFAGCTSGSRSSDSSRCGGKQGSATCVPAA